MSGTYVNSAAKFGAPSFGCLIVIMSEYEPTVLIVSLKDSPFATEDEPGSEKPITSPPSLNMAASNENLVLVLGS